MKSNAAATYINCTIDDLHNVQLEMLHVLDDICKKYSIPYMLFAGTALGAVRHQDFIPWDDDLDVVMLRDDYENFLRVAPTEVGKDYFIQKEFSEHWPMHFSKMRKNNTTYIERYVANDPLTHMGVYIDIFPCDNAYNSRVGRLAQFFASKIVIAKSLKSRGYITNSFTKKAFMTFSGLWSLTACHRFCVLRKKPDSKYVHIFFGASSKLKHSVFPRKWISECMMLPFGNSQFPVSAHVDDLLTVLYGDYMTPTPEDERVYKVHGEIVDLNRSYTDYVGIQETMTFDHLTRSIR